MLTVGKFAAVDIFDTSRPGVSVNLEQQLSDGVGLFARVGWADGSVEPWDFADIDRTVSGVYGAGAASARACSLQKMRPAGCAQRAADTSARDPATTVCSSTPRTPAPSTSGAGAASARAFGSREIRATACVPVAARTSGSVAGTTRSAPAPGNSAGAGAANARACGFPAIRIAAPVRAAADTARRGVEITVSTRPEAAVDRDPARRRVLHAAAGNRFPHWPNRSGICVSGCHFSTGPAMIIRALVILLASSLLSNAAHAAQIRILCPGALKGPIESLTAEFERACGHKVVVVFDIIKLPPAFERESRSISRWKLRPNGRPLPARESSILASARISPA